MADKVPRRAWSVVFAGTSITLCVGMLYAWSIWKKVLVNKAKADAGELLTGLNAGWPYLNDAQGTVAFFLCGLIFALFMIPGGRIQDRFGPKVGATIGGLSLALGCIIAGASKSYAGLIAGFGILSGIGMGIAYAATTASARSSSPPTHRSRTASSNASSVASKRSASGSTTSPRSRTRERPSVSGSASPTSVVPIRRSAI